MENKTLEELGLQLSEIRDIVIERIREIFKEHKTDEMRFFNFSCTPMITYDTGLDVMEIDDKGHLTFYGSKEFVDEEVLDEDEVGTDSLMDVLGLISESKFAKEDSDEMSDYETIVIE